MYNKWIYLSLGSNVGNRKKNLLWAKMHISKKATIIKTSRIYRSKAWGYEKQKEFLNQILKIDYKLNMWELLRFCKYIEKKLKRIKKFKWGPRTIDVDIIAYRNIILKRRQLCLPHRYAHERLFVIKPLLDVGAKLKLRDRNLKELLGRLEGERPLKTY